MAAWLQAKLKDATSLMDKLDAQTSSALTPLKAAAGPDKPKPKDSKDLALDLDIDRVLNDTSTAEFETDAPVAPEKPPAGGGQPSDTDLFNFLNDDRAGAPSPGPRVGTPAPATRVEHVEPSRVVHAEPVAGAAADGRGTPSPPRDTAAHRAADEVARNKSEETRVVIEELRRQNEMLATENEKLSKQKTALTARNKGLEETIKKAKAAIDQLRDEAAVKDKDIATLRAKQEDFAAMMADKENALQAVMSKMEDLRAKLQTKEALVGELAQTREALALEIGASTETQRHTMEALRAETRDRDEKLAEERAAHEATKQRAMEREQELERQNADCIAAVSAAQRKAEDSHASAARAEVDVRALRQELETAKAEHQEYQARSVAVVQSNKRLIADLQAKLSGDSGSLMSIADMETVRRERDQAKIDLDSMTSKRDDLRQKLQDAEERGRADKELMGTQIDDLNDTVQRERQRADNFQKEAVARTQQSKAATEEMERMQSLVNAQLKDKDEEIAKLKKKLATAQASLNVDSQNQLQKMADHLYQKQTEVEGVKAEKRALQLRLETSLQQRDAPPAETSVPMGEPDDDGFSTNFKSGEGMRFRSTVASLPFLRDDSERGESSSLRQHAHKMANLLDNFSIMMGNFLRIYPIARLAFLLYIVMLHVWVLYVLAMVTPEVHFEHSTPGVAGGANGMPGGGGGGGGVNNAVGNAAPGNVQIGRGGPD